MQNTIKIATIRGAGLSFPLACVLFLFLGEFIVFALIPVGALIGFGVGAFLAKNPTAERKLQAAMMPTGPKTGGQSWAAKYLLHAVLILGGSMLMRVNRVALGYLTALYNVAGYGLFIGTNSFAIPMPERLGPSLAILERSGPYEMLGLIVLASASFGWSFFEIKQLFRTNPERVQPGPRIAWHEFGAALAGVGILAAANWVEASMVMAAALTH